MSPQVAHYIQDYNYELDFGLLHHMHAHMNITVFPKALEGHNGVSFWAFLKLG